MYGIGARGGWPYDVQPEPIEGLSRYTRKIRKVVKRLPKKMAKYGSTIAPFAAIIPGVGPIVAGLATAAGALTAGSNAGYGGGGAVLDPGTGGAGNWEREFPGGEAEIRRVAQQSTLHGRPYDPCTGGWGHWETTDQIQRFFRAGLPVKGPDGNIYQTQKAFTDARWAEINRQKAAGVHVNERWNSRRPAGCPSSAYRSVAAQNPATRAQGASGATFRGGPQEPLGIGGGGLGGNTGLLLAGVAALVLLKG